MVANPKGLGSENDFAGEDQQQLQTTDPSSRQGGRYIRTMTSSIQMKTILAVSLKGLGAKTNWPAEKPSVVKELWLRSEQREIRSHAIRTEWVLGSQERRGRLKIYCELFLLIVITVTAPRVIINTLPIQTPSYKSPIHLTIWWNGQTNISD
jgi:hypothetical protein